MKLSPSILIWAAALFAQSPIRVDVDLAQIPCVVTDNNGAVVTDLKPAEFTITENGVPQPIKYLWREIDLPLTIGLVADVSGSQSGFVAKHQQTLSQFLSRVLAKDDRAFLVAVSKQQRLVTDLTGSQDSLQQGIQILRSQDSPILGDPCSGRQRDEEAPQPGARIKRKVRVPRSQREVPCGGTALWNGVYFSAKLKLKPEQGRKALLVLTDGFDTGSDHGLTEAIEACQSADTVVYGLFYAESPYLPAIMNPIAAPITIGILKSRISKGKRDLNQITLETGGTFFDGGHTSLQDIFARIENDLRGEYVLGFTPSTHVAGIHKIKVTVTRPGLQVRARQWYSQ